MPATMQGRNFAAPDVAPHQITTTSTLAARAVRYGWRRVRLAVGGEQGRGSRWQYSVTRMCGALLLLAMGVGQQVVGHPSIRRHVSPAPRYTLEAGVFR